MNCCDAWGHCKQGAGCPARATHSRFATHSGGEQIDTTEQTRRPLKPGQADRYSLRWFAGLAAYTFAVVLVTAMGIGLLAAHL